MKKLLTVLLLMLCLCVGGCKTNEVVLVDDTQSAEVKAPLRMIKVDGRLYYDSGVKSELKSRCGTLDGRLKKVGAIDEIPKNDNECNFDGAAGYQHSTSISKEVQVDGRWVVFKLFDDAELDMNVYKYCFYLKGRLPNAEKDSEFAILTEDRNCTFEKWSQTILHSKYKPGENKYKSTFKVYGNADKWGLSLYGKAVTDTGMTLCVEQFGGNPMGDIQTGAAFFIEEYKSGKWSAVPTTPPVGDYAWNSIAYKISKNEITELNVDWEWLYGRLPAGNYRIGKEFMDFRKSGDFDKENYYAYFTIE